MNSLPQENVGQNILLKLATLVVILAGIKLSAEIVVPFLLALFFAIVINPLVSVLIRRGVRRGIAIALVMVVMLLLLTLVGIMVAGSLQQFSEVYPQLQAQSAQKLGTLQHLAARFHLNISSSSLVQRLDPGAMMDVATTMLKQFSGAMTQLILVVMTVIFMLFEVHHLPYKLRYALINPQIHIAGLHKALKGVTHYLALKALISLITGVLVWLALLALGIKFALLWGIVAFVLNFIPNIGPVLAGIPPILQALLLNTPLDAGLVAALFVSIHMLLGNLLEPRIVGRGLGLSSLVVFLSLIFWGWLLGPVGMLLSVPLTSVSKILMETTPGGGRLAILLGNGRRRARP